ncbi:LysR family transcriptional regulator [Vibrio fluvialis]|nr:LysR family transcriptional regulator [Vibrio fluvialis]
MKLHQIKAFLAVSQAGSLKTAAEQLHLTQPALSKAIKELEQQYGVALFERSASGLTLTPYGERLLGYARMMNETARRAKQDIDTMRGISSCLVTVGVTPIASLIKSLTTSLNEFMHRHPEVTLRIVELRPAPLLEQIRQGGVDFAITSQIPVIDSALDWQAICRIPNVVVTRKSHPLCNTRSLRVLHQSEWVTLDAPDDPNTYHYQLFAVNGLPIPSRIRECTSMTLARSLIQTADLAALFSTESLELDYIKNEFAVVPLLDNIPDSVISVVRPKRDIMTQSAMELFERILQDMRDIYPEFQ